MEDGATFSQFLGYTAVFMCFIAILKSCELSEIDHQSFLIMKEEHQNIASIPEKELDKHEAPLIWDEYKYRHDLIWRHMIRTTLAVIGSITLPLTVGSSGQPPDRSAVLILGILVALLLYLLLTFWIISAELRLFNAIKTLYRGHQQLKHELKHKEASRFNTFKTRVNLLLILLLLSAISNLMYWTIELCGK